MGWSGKSRKVRLRGDSNISDERDPKPADQQAGGFTHTPDYGEGELDD
jgi:hypothetical protein